MIDILKTNLDEFLEKINLIKNSKLTKTNERERRIYFCYNMNTYVIYCIAFEEHDIQHLTRAISNITPNSKGIIMYDYYQF
jgi:hypothetical protein